MTVEAGLPPLVASSKSAWHRWGIVVAKLVISAALVTVLVRGVDFSATTVRLGQIGFMELAEVLGLTFLGAALAAWRWRIMAAAFGHDLPYSWSLKALIISMFFNQTLPSSIGGDAIRIWYLARREHAVADAVVIVLADRVVALAALLIMVAIGLPFLLPMIGSVATRTGLGALALGGAVGTAILFVGGSPMMCWFGHQFPPAQSLTAKLARVLAPFRGRMVLLKALPLSLVLHGLTAMTAFAIARGMELPVSATDCLLLIPPVLLISVAPIAVAGWGVREGAMVAGFALVGVGPEAALGLSILFGLAGVLGGVPGGVLWLSDMSSRRQERAACAKSD